MNENNLQYRQDIAFINREKELHDLRNFVDKRPAEILFLHGPKSSGKTTLLYKFLEQVEKEQRLNVKFLNLRESITNIYEDFLKVMKAEFLKLTEQGFKPVLVIDELQALADVYVNNDREQQLVIALFNFFVAMTKESHLAHIIIASSDGYFINTVYTDSRLKKTSAFYKVDYLQKEDVLEWLLNLDKYSRIKDYSLTPEDAGKIWDTVGGSMWEIQYILTELFDNPIDEVLALYKKKMKGVIAYYIGADDKKEKSLALFLNHERATIRDFVGAGIGKDEVEILLRDMVKNNILYFDPTEAVYSPQGRSYQWGIKLYFESLT